MGPNEVRAGRRAGLGLADGRAAGGEEAHGRPLFALTNAGGTHGSGGRMAGTIAAKSEGRIGTARQISNGKSLV